MKDKDSFIHYIFKVVQEKLKSIDKRLSEQGHSGMEGADVILGHLKNMAQVLINYAGIYWLYAKKIFVNFTRFSHFIYLRNFRTIVFTLEIIHSIFFKMTEILNSRKFQIFQLIYVKKIDFTEFYLVFLGAKSIILLCSVTQSRSGKPFIISLH